MKAKDLIKILQEDPEREIVCAVDSEGNSFNAISVVEKCKYNKRKQEIGIEDLTQDHILMGYSKEDVMKGGVKAFVLWP
jgi:hypothetical protein